MKVYTLMQQDTDTIGPSVTVHRELKDAVNVAIEDIVRNNTIIVDGPHMSATTWSCTVHKKDDWNSRDYLVEIKEHEV